MRLDLPFRGGQQSPKVNFALWSIRTGLEYVPVIVGGSAVLACIQYALRILPIALIHPGMGPSIRSIWVLFEFMLVPIISPWPILGWIMAGAALFACARLSRSYPETLTLRLVLAGVFGLVSLVAMVFFGPADVIALFTPDNAYGVSEGYTEVCAVLIGALFGFIRLPRFRSVSLEASPMLRAHWIAAAVWALSFGIAWAYGAPMLWDLASAKEPRISLFYVRWMPADGPVREQPIGPGVPNLYLTDREIGELRAAGLTGILQVWGSQIALDPGSVRFVVIAGRPFQETVDLPKPASGDILYLQTQQGWRQFPASAPTIHRTVRLVCFPPDAQYRGSTMHPHVDNGIGHPSPKSNPSQWLYSAIEWPQDWDVLPPSLPDNAQASSQ